MTSTVNIGAALNYGLDRLTTRGGAILIGAYVLYQLVAQVGIQSLFADLLSDTLSAEQVAQTYPLALEVPLSVSAGVSALLLLGGMVLFIVAMRAIHADIDQIPTADHTRRLARTVVVTIVVSVIYSLAVMVGTVFLIIPGIFLAVALVFAQLAVILEDAGVLEAFKRSWSLTSGNRLRLFALGLIIGVVGGVVGGTFGIIGMFAPVVADLLSTAVIGVLSVFGLAVLVGAYEQLADDIEGEPNAL